ncbi:MAG: tetratricopeptide (TPR) repeat protein [Chlamydiales bacterium]|jgi:tetratricopeptide (TPR) repeat protein
MKLGTMATLVGAWLGMALVGCRSATTEVTQGAGVDGQAVAERPGAGNRPVVLNYKDERERQALLGLTYTAGRVGVDPVEASLRVGAVDGARAAVEFEQGLAQIRRNATLAGLASHTRAVLLDPEEARMYEGLGDALRVARLETRAEAAYRTGLGLEPSALMHIKLAEMLWMRAAREPAIEHALQAIAFDATSERASANLARWYYFTGAYGRAWKYVHRCEALGVPLPSQFRPLLASHMLEPSSAPR